MSAPTTASAHSRPVPGICQQDFSILKQKINGNPLIYLDNAATSQKADCVVAAMSHYYHHDNSNVHRGMHPLSRRATARYENARKTMAQFLNTSSSKEIIFTKGTTEGINLVAQSWGRANLQPGDKILVGEFEHHSNLVPWYLLAQQTGAELISLPLNDDFSGFDMAVLKAALADPGTKLFAFTMLSNSLGIPLPAPELCQLAAQHQVITVLDAAQAAPHCPIDVQAIGCDFLAMSGHKCIGPTGIGALYGKTEHLEQMLPYQGGGEMIDNVSFENITYKPSPHRFEAGTPPIAEAIGLAAAIAYLDSMGFDAITKHEQDLGAYALDQLQQLEDIKYLSPKPVAGPLISFNLAGIHAHDAADLAGEAGVAMRAGHHCCQPLMRKCGVPATLRASWSVYNTRDDIDALIAVIKDIQSFFKRNSM